MRITLIQDIIHWASKAENLQKAENQIASLSGKTDLVVLPEMFSTGFCIDKLDLAEEMSQETVTKLIYWAQKFNLAITGSFIAKEDSKIYNRGFFVFPNGEIKIADKRHLFSMGGEDNYFSAGNKKLTVNYCGFNICLLICYDLRFPVWARNVQNEYDLLIYVANFPEKRISNWDILLRARAVENQAYVCGLNRIGIDGLGINYNGHSTLLDFNAVQLLNFPENEFSIQTYDLQLDNLNKFRKKFAFWRDADIFGVEV
jgi:predicted amidohydrolase